MSKKQYTTAFKVKVALEALKEQQSLAQLSSQFQLHPNQIRRWRDILKNALPTIFNKNSQEELKEKEALITQLFQQLGQLTYELDWLKKKLPFR